MKARSNGPASAGSPASNASSAGALTTVIRSSAIPACAPPAAGEVGPLAVRVDRHDRAVGRLAERQPQRRVAVGRPDLDDPPPAGGEHLQDPAGVAIDDRDAERLGGGLDGGERPAASGAGERLDPVEVGRRRGSSSRSFLLISPSSDEQPGAEIEPAARIVPAAIVPTLMYSSPVADSIDRVRAVWTAAHETTSGKISPTIRRSQTNSAHGPTSAANGATSAGPAPVATQTTNSTTWTATTASSTRDRRMSGASGSLGVTRYQWPEDHRREDAADRRG